MGLAQRIRPIDDGRELAGFDEFLQDDQVVMTRYREISAQAMADKRGQHQRRSREQGKVDNLHAVIVGPPPPAPRRGPPDGASAISTSCRPRWARRLRREGSGRIRRRLAMRPMRCDCARRVACHFGHRVLERIRMQASTARLNLHAGGVTGCGMQNKNSFLEKRTTCTSET